MEDLIKILLVEDEIVDRMAVRRALKAAGVNMQISEAEDCRTARALLQQEDFDCAFLDYRLPDGDGLGLLQQIRSMGSKVPLIVLTGQGDEQTAVELMKAGASDYISKHKISPEALSRSLYNAVRLYRAETEAALATSRLRESEERYRLVVEGSNDGIWDWDLDTHRIYCNDRMYEIVGLSPDEVTVTYDLFCQVLHPSDRLRVSQVVSDHLQQQGELEVEFRLRHHLGDYRYCLARGKAQRDPMGKPLRVSGIVSDITERKRAEETLRFLSEASSLLSASLDYEKTLESVTQLAVPFMADLCMIDVLENGRLRRISVACQHPEAERVKEILYRYPPDLSSPHAAVRVLQSGKPEMLSNVSEEDGIAISQTPEHLEIVRLLAVKSSLTVPLKVRTSLLGAISFASTQSARRYNQGDLALAEELARRAVLSIENGQLYLEAQQASDNLRQAIAVLGEQQQQLRTLQQLTNLLNQRLTDLPGLLRVMVGAVCEAILEAEFCFIMLHNPQCDRMVLTVTAGEGAEKLRLEEAYTSTDGWLHQVFVTGLSQLFSVPFREEASVSQASIYAVAIESAQAGRLGVLAVGNWQDGEAFGEEDRQLLSAVGEQAAIAIDNARQIKTLEEQEERLENQNQILAQQNQELERQQQQLQLQNLQLMEAARLKSQFLATMSHELRTPMNAIIGFSQLMLRQKSSPLTNHQEDMVTRILNNGKNLLMLINEILDLSRLESGRLSLKQEAFDLDILVRETADELLSLATEKKLWLRVHSSLQNPCVVNDSTRLRQILANLISNGLKFTETGGVEIEVKEVSPDRMTIAVKDTGIGISPEDLQHIFEEFRQVDQTTTRKYSGTGLGLAITESLVHLMQGKITVESQLNQGSIFSLELPRQIPASDLESSHITRLPGITESGDLPPTFKKSRPGRQLY